MSDLDRFWSKVIIRDMKECWEWRDKIHSTGYAYFNIGGTPVLAHRFMYEQVNGPIPYGYQVDHLCKNTKCINPQHLEAVTPAENTRRSNTSSINKVLNSPNGNKTHCPKGHEYNEENTRIYFNQRICRACRREGEAARRRKKLEL